MLPNQSKDLSMIAARMDLEECCDTFIPVCIKSLFTDNDKTINATRAKTLQRLSQWRFHILQGVA